jgi:hypothetical protein
MMVLQNPTARNWIKKYGKVMVRGVFDGLTADQRAELLAHAAEHDVLDATRTCGPRPRTCPRCRWANGSAALWPQARANG